MPHGSWCVHLLKKGFLCALNYPGAYSLKAEWFPDNKLQLVPSLLKPEGRFQGLLSFPFRDAELRRAAWKLNDISEVSEQETQGCLRAKFDLKGGGPIKPHTTMLQFGADGANLSGTDFELIGLGYRISLTKKRFCTGDWVFLLSLH